MDIVEEMLKDHSFDIGELMERSRKSGSGIGLSDYSLTEQVLSSGETLVYHRQNQTAGWV